MVYPSLSHRVALHMMAFLLASPSVHHIQDSVLRTGGGTSFKTSFDYSTSSMRNYDTNATSCRPQKMNRKDSKAVERERERYGGKTENQSKTKTLYVGRGQMSRLEKQNRNEKREEGKAQAGLQWGTLRYVCMLYVYTKLYVRVDEMTVCSIWNDEYAKGDSSR